MPTEQIAFAALGVVAFAIVLGILIWDELDWRRKHGKRGK
jgi:hypothetical protein